MATKEMSLAQAKISYLQIKCLLQHSTEIIVRAKNILSQGRRKVTNNGEALGPLRPLGGVAVGWEGPRAPLGL